jgi:hypothetical protein
MFLNDHSRIRQIQINLLAVSAMLLISPWPLAHSSDLSQKSTEKSYSFVGHAVNSKKELVYTENTKVIETAAGLTKEIQTDYKNPKGETIATMTSSFDKKDFIPNVVFEDLRFQIKETIQLSEDGKSLLIELIDNKKKTTQKSNLKISDKMVAGPGFNNFLIANFEALKNTPKGKNIDFVVLAKADDFNFDIVKKEESEKSITFVMKIHNWFLRQFLAPINVEYDQKTKRLLRFEGLTNIQTEKGKPQELTITYIYNE